MAETFQRSSSCVEGRNGVLSLNYHRFHRLNERALKALTIVHNFDTKRKDGTTAAERFFGAKHENLFESLVANVRIPGKPKQQHHDKQKRFLGWEKRRAAQGKVTENVKTSENLIRWVLRRTQQVLLVLSEGMSVFSMTAWWNWEFPEIQQHLCLTSYSFQDLEAHEMR